MFQGQSLDLKVNELAKAKTDYELLTEDYEQLSEEIVHLREQRYSLQEQLNFTRELLKEEKLERKELTDRVQVFAGLKEREYNELPITENKDWQPVSRSRTRTSIKRQLEDRAVELLEQQRKKEDKEINKGELAPGDVLLEEVKH